MRCVVHVRGRASAAPVPCTVIPNAATPRLTVILPARMPRRRSASSSSRSPSRTTRSLGDRRHRQRFPRRHRGDRAELVRPARESPPGGVPDGRRKPGAQRRSSGGAGDFVLVCDADDAVTPGGSVAWHLVSSPSTSSAACSTTRVERARRPSRAGRLARDGAPIAPNGHRYAVGANIAFRRGVHEAIDGFDESFRIGSDEIDFCLRSAVRGLYDRPRTGCRHPLPVAQRHARRLPPELRVRHGVRASSPQAHRSRHARAPGRLHQAKVAVEHCRSVAAVWRVVDPAQRARYARGRRVVRRFAGFLRYGVVV